MVIIIVALVVILTPGVGYADGFPATKYPFLPTLTANHEPALCKIFLDHATKLFMSTDPGPALGEVEHPSISWVKWEGVWEQVDFKNIPGLTEEQKMDVYRHMVSGGHTYLRADLDLDGNGRMKTIVEHSFPESGGRTNDNGYIFKSPEAFTKSLNEAIRQVPSDHKDLQGLNLFAAATQYLFEDDAWSEHQLFQYKKRFYFPSSGTKGEVGQSVSISRLSGDGSTKVICSVQMVPDERDIPTFSTLPGIGSYLQIVRTMGHAGEDGWCDIEDNHDGEPEGSVRRAHYRPWAVARSGTRYLGNNRSEQCYQYSPLLEAFIRGWGYKDIWNYREYQTSRSHIEPAIQAVAEFLEQNFGVPHSQVAKEARRVVEDLTAAWFLVPKYWDESIGADVTQEAIIKGDVQAVRSFEKQLVAETIDQKGYLLAAVESLPITRILLEHGADPNKRNGFGKTALMYAAHMNRPDVMKELLEHKADVQAVTEPIDEYDMRVEQSARTALMYAAENAHPAAMALLVKWGADINAKDSQGNDVGYYLAKNPLLTPSEREMALPALLESYRDRPMTPSFNCQGATRKVDRLICGDGILSMQDQAMGKAYRVWLERAPSSDSKKDQVRWVKARDAACADLAESSAVTCLQQWTRARVRYLHNRLAERY